MSFTVQCAQCLHSFFIPEKARGKRVKCPHCALIFLVPEKPQTTELELAPLAPDTQQQPPEISVRTKRRETDISLPCSHCGKTLRIPQSLVGKKVKCPYCTTPFLFSDAHSLYKLTPATLPTPPAPRSVPAPPPAPFYNDHDPFASLSPMQVSPMQVSPMQSEENPYMSLLSDPISSQPSDVLSTLYSESGNPYQPPQGSGSYDRPASRTSFGGSVSIASLLSDTWTAYSENFGQFLSLGATVFGYWFLYVLLSVFLLVGTIAAVVAMKLPSDAVRPCMLSFVGLFYLIASLVYTKVNCLGGLGNALYIVRGIKKNRSFFDPGKGVFLRAYLLNLIRGAVLFGIFFIFCFMIGVFSGLSELSTRSGGDSPIRSIAVLQESGGFPSGSWKEEPDAAESSSNRPRMRNTIPRSRRPDFPTRPNFPDRPGFPERPDFPSRPDFPRPNVPRPNVPRPNVPTRPENPFRNHAPNHETRRESSPSPDFPSPDFPSPDFPRPDFPQHVPSESPPDFRDSEPRFPMNIPVQEEKGEEEEARFSKIDDRLDSQQFDSSTEPMDVGQTLLIYFVYYTSLAFITLCTNWGFLFLIDRQVGFAEAFTQSFSLYFSNFLPITVSFFVLAIPAFILGIMLCGLGVILISIPLINCFFAVAYLKIERGGR